MKKTKRGAWRCALPVLLALCLLFGGCAPAAPSPVVHTKPTVAPAPEAGAYTEETAGWALERLYAVVGEIERGLYGAPAARTVRMSLALTEAIRACEARGIQEDDFRAAIGLLYAEVPTLAERIAALRAGQGDAGDLVGLFGNVAATLGTDTTARLFYDLGLIVCKYMNTKYHDLYNSSSAKPAYLLKEAEEWMGHAASLTAIGEEDVACLVRVLVGGVCAFSGQLQTGTQGLSVSAADAALLLRAEGTMLARLTLTEADFGFVLRALGASKLMPGVAAICSVEGSAAYAKTANGFCMAVATALQAADMTVTEPLLSGDIAGFLFALTRHFGDAEWAAVDAFFGSSAAPADYEQFYEAENKAGAYARFCESMTPCDLAELRGAGKQDFARILQNYLSGASPALAFWVYAYDQG